MNSKKFLSGLSAIAIVASAFSGMTITANAATLLSYANDTFNDMTQEASSSSLITNDMTWSISTGSVSVRNISSNEWASSPSYLMPMPMARSGQGNFSSFEGNFLYLVSNTGTTTPATATGTITDPVKTITDGTISFNYALPTVQTGTGRQRRNNTQTLSITDGENTLAKIAVTEYMASGSATQAYDGSSSTVVVSDASGEHKITYTTATNTDTVGWNTFSMTISENPKTIKLEVTPHGQSKQEVSYSYETNNGIKNIEWSGNTDGSNNVGNIALDNIAFLQSSVDTGYILNTTPYSTIVIDNTTTVSSDATGKYIFDLNDSGQKNIAISKNGYTSRTETIDIQKNTTGTYTLTPSDSSVTYFEDFSNVNDSFGFDQFASTSDGVLKINGKGDATTSFSTPIDVKGKLITLTTYSTVDRNAYLKLEGTGLEIYYYGTGAIRINGANKSNSGFITDGVFDIPQTIQIYIPETGNASVYGNGKKGSDVSLDGATGILTGLTYTTTYTGGIAIDDITISNIAPTEAKLTIDDNGSQTTTTYISGTNVKLPEPAGKEGYEFKGWSNGVSTVAAGSIISVDENVTYTAVYAEPVVQPTIGTVETLKDTWTAGDGVYAKLYTFNVTSGTFPVTSVSVTLNDKTITKDNLKVSGEAIFGIIVSSSNETILDNSDVPTVTVQ